MANLIASPALQGNLSLGIFGNWGSGKSFFMRRLRAAIDDLTAGAAANTASNAVELPTHWPNVVQIEFNAWHYSDANLWASLVSHLLEQLQAFRPRSGEETSQRSALKQALEQLSP